MDKTKNIISYYLYVNKLKYKLREGFVQIGITKDRLDLINLDRDNTKNNKLESILQNKRYEFEI